MSQTSRPKIIVVLGIMLTLIWSAVTAISRGLPRLWCQLIDMATGERFTETVFKMANGFYYPVENNEMPTVIFLWLFGFAFALYAVGIRLIEKSKNDTKSLTAIVAFAVVFRLILLPSEPVHENDFYRYLWDGKSIKHGINPFKYAPADLYMYQYGYTEDYYDAVNRVRITYRDFNTSDRARLELLTDLRDEHLTLYERIGHWQVPTIYPPVAQAVFWLSSVTGGDSFRWMKFIFMWFDVGVILLLIALLKNFRRNPAMVIIYAWSPLVMKEFPNSGHYDPIPVFFTMLSLVLLFQKRWVGAHITLGLATLSKFFSGVLLPLFIRMTRWRPVPAFVATCLLLYVPFLFWNDTTLQEIFQGLNTYNEEWAYNASIFAVIYRVMEWINADWTQTLIPAKMVAAGLLGLFMIYLMLLKDRGETDLLHRCFLALSALFIINPVGDPWYFCWCIPFLCFFPYRSWLLLSGTLILSYLNFQSIHPIVDMETLKIPTLSWIIYLPFFVLLALETLLRPKYLTRSDE